MKRLIAIVLCALLVLGCSSVAFADQVFTVHHIGSMQHPYQKGAEYFQQPLEEYSNGEMSLDIFGANQLAAGAKAVEGVQLGAITSSLRTR